MMRRVRAAATYVWGSNEERSKHRRQAFCLQRRIGNPSIFFTLSPKDNGSNVVVYLAGKLDVATLADLSVENMPTPARRFTASSADPVASARYFHRVIEFVERSILRFDRAHGVPLRGGGIFGHVRDYVGGVETQGDGTLHAHFIVWLYESSRGQVLYPDGAILDSDGRTSLGQRVRVVPYQFEPCPVEDVHRKFSAYIDSISVHTLPLCPHECPCPTATCNANPVALKPVETIPPDAFKPTKRDRGPVPLSHCERCGSAFGSSALVVY